MKKLTAIASLFMTFLIMPASSEGTLQTAEIYGQVHDPLGIPLAKAEIKVFSVGKVVASAITDEEGRYSFKGLREVHATIQVEAAEFRIWKQDVHIKPGEKIALDICMEVGLITDPPELQISGRVLQSNNKPLQDARILVINPYSGAVIAQAMTDQMGRYNLWVYRVGQYVIFAHKPGYEGESKTVILLRDHTLDFSLKKIDLK